MMKSVRIPVFPNLSLARNKILALIRIGKRLLFVRNYYIIRSKLASLSILRSFFLNYLSPNRPSPPNHGLVPSN
jgi:hypothetical protein